MVSSWIANVFWLIFLCLVLLLVLILYFWLMIDVGMLVIAEFWYHFSIFDWYFGFSVMTTTLWIMIVGFYSHLMMIKRGRNGCYMKGEFFWDYKFDSWKFLMQWVRGSLGSIFFFLLSIVWSSSKWGRMLTLVPNFWCLQNNWMILISLQKIFSVMKQIWFKIKCNWKETKEAKCCRRSWKQNRKSNKVRGISDVWRTPSPDIWKN